MSFEDKVYHCLHNIAEIEKPSYSRHALNLYADFVELLAMSANSDGISFGDILDRFFGMPDETNTAEKSDRDEAFIDKIYTLIEERIALYGDLYPFILSDKNVLTLNEAPSLLQKLYLVLLISSSLDIFRLFNTEITTDFETICFETMQSFLPNAIVKEFGKNSKYTGTASEKIRKLAYDMGLPIDDYEISQVGERNAQERGLDIVGWLPFTDNCNNIIVFLCQCACGKQYESKQHDTRRFENYYKFYKTKPQHTIFIPYSLVNPKERKFYHSDLIEKGYLVFERMRILSLIKDKRNIYNQLKSKDLVEKCIELYSV